MSKHSHRHDHLNELLTSPNYADRMRGADLLFRKHFQRLNKSWILDAHDSVARDDAISQAFENLVNRLGRGPISEPLNDGAWISRITRNAQIGLIRNEQKHIKSAEELMTQGPSAFHNRYATEEQVLSDEQFQEAIRAANEALKLARLLLTEKAYLCFEIVLRNSVEGLSVPAEKGADYARTTPGNFRTQLSHAKRTMRRAQWVGGLISADTLSEKELADVTEFEGDYGRFVKDGLLPTGTSAAEKRYRTDIRNIAKHINPSL